MMLRMTLAMIGLAAVIRCTPAADHEPQVTSPIAGSHWEITLETDGGLTGHGIGRIVAGSEGNTVVRTLAAGCERPMSEEQRRRLSERLEAALQVSWRETYVESDTPPGADQIHYRLSVRAGDERRATGWYDGSRSSVPKQVQDLEAALWEVRDDLAEECDGTVNR
jgi:hypothetical protein